MADPTYTVFIRVPLPRGDFVDPPPVNWDSRKDEALWKILSGVAKTDVDWNEVADRFEVPVGFLLQQVAYLTDRHASQVRAQVRKATAAAKGSAAPSPVPGSDSTGPSHLRTASGLSIRRDSPMPQNDVGSGSGTPLTLPSRPNMSRNTSTGTAVIRDMAASSAPRSGAGVAAVRAGSEQRKRLSSLPITTTRAASPKREPEAEKDSSPGSAESSIIVSSDGESSPAQSRIIRRPPRFQKKGESTAYDADDDDESEPAFQPYGTNSDKTAQGMGSTLRDDSAKRLSKTQDQDSVQQSQNSDSSTGYTAWERQPGLPRQQRNPGSKSRGYSREGSDGTTSMGSSFSDLDDASVTQSALEEALASHMDRRGAGGSRFSISQAFRSRHTPGSG